MSALWVNSGTTNKKTTAKAVLVFSVWKSRSGSKCRSLRGNGRANVAIELAKPKKR
jgi:hypothetical protein